MHFCILMIILYVFCVSFLYVCILCVYYLKRLHLVKFLKVIYYEMSHLTAFYRWLMLILRQY